MSNDTLPIPRETEQTIPTVIVDNRVYATVAQYVIEAKESIKTIKEYFKPLKKDAEVAYKNWIQAEKESLAPWEHISESGSKAMTAYNIEQEKIRLAEEAKLRAEALKREEDERLNAAAQAEKEGNKEEAEAILAEPIHVACPIIPINVARVNGLTMRETWQFRVTDLKALVKAVAEGKVPLMAIKPDDTFLGQQARSLKGTVQYPGIEFFSVKNMAGARR